MLGFFTNILDRILFATSMIIAMQLPAFIQQYSQRLAGHLSEAKYQLENYQVIADQHYQGDILLLIKRYQANSDPGINAAADVVFQLIDRISILASQLQHLNHSDYFHKIFYFVSDLNLPLAKATLQDYQLSIPLDLPSLLTGLVVAIIVGFLMSATLAIFRRRT